MGAADDVDIRPYKGIETRGLGSIGSMVRNLEIN